MKSKKGKCILALNSCWLFSNYFSQVIRATLFGLKNICVCQSTNHPTPPSSPLSQLSNATSTMFFMTGKNSEVSRASWWLVGPCSTLLSHSSTTKRICHSGKVCSRSPRLRAPTAWNTSETTWVRMQFYKQFYPPLFQWETPSLK